ncbi:MAG: hypothetical protein MR510_12940 [Clostridium sp.]|uniref:hypothetical protein n=1 Tax=Clostridium sp. TaxID=1506 RepID=UPI002A83D901|nr:hypothetical protein [Clostridium sp.]MCI6693365.1 hypothetical protein [Clostridium sp.]MDY4253512.1 hypothetical protein [Clostridium sp.]MDY6227775.1 hypothetical protein [Clostridium sp.]
MYLQEKNVLVTEIMLDIINPRLGRKVNYSQNELAKYLQRGKKSKELLTSMKSGLTWVNKIVITRVDELSVEEIELYEEYNKNFINEYKYVVTEGNTRLACLLHDSMRAIFNLKETIPVVIARKSEGESEKEFLRERKRLQSIANVMIVVDWEDVPKAKQLYESYILIKEISPEKIEKDIFKELAENIGLATSLVKKLIYRYIFYKELIENVESIEEKDFKFFEVFEQNGKIRAMFGLDIKNSIFEWELLDEIDDENLIELIEKKQELLYWFPKLIEIAKDEKISSKKLRDIIRENYVMGVEDFHQRIKDIIEYSTTDEYCNDCFSRFFKSETDIKQEEKLLEGNIKNIIQTLKSFPVNQDYAVNFKEDIIKVKDISNRILKMLELDDNEGKCN